MGLEAYRETPWWWVYILSLVNLCKNRMELAAQSRDGKTAPPRDIWLDKDAIDTWVAEEKQAKTEMMEQ